MKALKQIEIVREAIMMAESGKSKLTKEILSLEGWSSDLNRHFLNNILELRGKGCNYLETGTWKGSTFISAMYKNSNVKGIAIENFCSGLDVKSAFIENTSIYLSDVNWELLEIDCKSKVISDFTDKIDIYFYDGPHEHEDQRYAFTSMNKNLNNTFIAIIDDWNWEDVRKGTKQAFNELNYSVIKEWEYFPENADIYQSSKGDRQQGEWWNGMYIGVIQK
ncbi:MAG: hypothetical protein EHM12_10620 [Dehalococcoidia bacterium]|nr:MAG: hypothetical protein EHM12_10620 [Dehalococcoidia bacterium]